MPFSNTTPVYTAPVVSTTSPIRMLDYAVGDGVANDTAAVLGVFSRAITEKVAVYSEYGAEYLVDELTVTGELHLEGEFVFSARTTNQASVFNLLSKVDWSDAEVWINGKNRAYYGLRGTNFGRSEFGTLDIQRCKIWGKQFEPSGNNNVVSVDKFVARLNGVKSTQVLTETAETANVLTSSAGYGTFTLTTPLTLQQVASNVTYWVISGGLPYKVRTITTTTIEIFNLKAALGVGGTVSADIIIGGGLNIPAYGDSGVGRWGSMDVSSNAGNGVHIASLYGHSFDSLVLQANGIGFSCSEYTIGHEMKVYFESNGINYVSWSYVDGIMKAPTMDLSTIHNCINRLAGNGNYDPKLIVLKSNIPGLASPLVPGVNPGPRTLVPGQCYAYSRTNTVPWTFTIDNDEQYNALGSYIIMAELSHTNTTPNTLSIALGSNNGQTIEGIAYGTAYTDVKLTGKATIKITRVGTNWSVTVTMDRTPLTSISNAPIYEDQRAIVAGVGYMAVGTASAADWKQITN